MTDTNPSPVREANTKFKATDLGDLDTVAASDKGAELELLHPSTKAPTGIFIGLLGKHSTVFQEVVNERTNKRLRDEALRVRRGKEAEPVTAEKVKERAVELLTVCTTHWHSVTKNEKGVIVEDVPTINLRGETLTFNANNVARVYTEMFWIQEQVDAFIGDLENFMKG